MKTVQPIRDHAKIDAMKKALLCKSERNYFLFVLGINVGMRISDLLPLRIAVKQPEMLLNYKAGDDAQKGGNNA